MFFFNLWALRGIYMFESWRMCLQRVRNDIAALYVALLWLNFEYFRIALHQKRFGIYYVNIQARMAFLDQNWLIRPVTIADLSLRQKKENGNLEKI